MQETNNAITSRVIALIIIAFCGWIISQLVKFAIYSISYKKPMWKMLYQTGGFPSSHTALIVSFLIAMTLIQLFELGYLDWSFAVAIVFGIIVIHDVKGLGYEARKHAILINKFIKDLPEDKRKEYGLGNEEELSIDFGNKGSHVQIGALIGAIVGVIGTLVVESTFHSNIKNFRVFTDNVSSVSNFFTERAMVVLIVGAIAMFIAQLVKMIAYSIQEKRFEWSMIYKSGGFPSSNVSFVVCVTLLLFLVQYNELGYLDWSFSVAVVLGFVMIHDEMGVRFQTARQAKVLNRIIADLTEEEKKQLDIKDSNILRELLGHKPNEVLVGAAIGVGVAFFGFIFIDSVLGIAPTNTSPMPVNIDSITQFITMRAMLIFIIATFGMLTAQFLKLIIYSLIYKKLAWDMLHSTGGFPSSHTSFVVSLSVALGMIQFHDLGYLDWSFVIAITFLVITLHDAMGVRYEASKHAIILNKMVASMDEEEKEYFGLINQPILKELLGHKKYEVVAGAIVGVIVGMIGFVIAITSFAGYNKVVEEAISTSSVTTMELLKIYF